MNEIEYLQLSDAEKKKVIEKLKKIFQERRDILFAVVHGSFIDLKEFRDIDIAIYVNPKYCEEKEFSKYVLDMSVQLTEKLGIPIDIQVLNDAPLMFTYEVLNRGKLIVCKDDVFFESYLTAIESEVWDFRYLLELDDSV